MNSIASSFTDRDRRAKLSLDPNNTSWSRSETKFGQKILESQGWRPGELLGAADTPYAALHTRANACHIRVALKDDTLGLGAKYGNRNEDGNTTGLDVFQNLLGRLNGKSEVELKIEQKTTSEARRSAFISQRWGSLRFVSGGLLVGDDLKELPKPRNVLGESDDGGGNASIKDTSPPLELSLHDPRAASKLGKAQRKAGKAERKLQRKLRREVRQKIRDEKSTSSPALILSDSGAFQLPDGKGETIPTAATSGSMQRSKVHSIHPSSRNAVRQRYIQHKKMSLMDKKALNEVC